MSKREKNLNAKTEAAWRASSAGDNLIELKT